MTDAINNYGQRAQSDPGLRSALEKTERKSTKLDAPAAAPAGPSARAPGPDEVLLSNVASRAMAEPSFVQSKVVSIKQAIHDGQYPLDPRRIAESFYAIEQMISE